MVKKDVFMVKSFSLTSLSEVSGVVSQLADLHDEKVLIHISSFIHNSVLVQTLKTQLLTSLPKAKIVLLRHDDKTTTSLELFIVENELDPQEMSDTIVHELFLQNQNQNATLKEYRDKLFNRYFTDHLTNLPNMYKLRKDLDENDDFSLIIVNIDNFRTINNFYGFIVGDYVIEACGKYLKEVISHERIYRLTGDEFALVLNHSLGFYELKEHLSELYKKLKDIKIVYQGMDIYIDLTMASCVNSQIDNIFSKVSMALKYAKQIGVPFWIYENRMNFELEYERNLYLSGIVRDAVNKSKIFPYFQAIMDTKTRKIVKYECLARLLDANEKILSPLLFIPVAKNIKIYSTVTRMIIDKSFAMFEENSFEFSVNLSIDDIMNEEIFYYILEKLKTSSASSRVIFEILESEVIQDFQKVTRFISEVRRYGAKIAIDDFGNGYSNFSYLTKMNPDYIKIDGEIIKDIDVDKTAYIVVETIVEFAKKLGIKTVAEYVHSSMVMDKVGELGIDYSQGYYIDEPSIYLKKK
ncbi:MAG TPA: diguanylate cyclase [Sulfurimonas sp. UBA12504]|nr:MAG TPA: diguanylate cyclase [Sulfurimonas sp. UBA12504]